MAPSSDYYFPGCRPMQELRCAISADEADQQMASMYLGFGFLVALIGLNAGTGGGPLCVRSFEFSRAAASVCLFLCPSIDGDGGDGCASCGKWFDGFLFSGVNFVLTSVGEVTSPRTVAGLPRAGLDAGAAIESG